MLAALTDWTPTMRPFQQAIAEPQRPLLACLAAGALLATEWCNYPPSGRASVSELSGRPLTLSLHANASRTRPGHATTTWRTPFAFSRRELLQICWQSGGSLQVRKSRLAGKTLRIRDESEHLLQKTCRSASARLTGQVFSRVCAVKLA